MLGFVIPLRHPRNSDNFDRVVSLLRGTLSSIHNSSCSNYHVLVVLNRPALAWLEGDASAQYLPVEFAPAGDRSGRRSPMYAHHIDKGLKFAVGARAAIDIGCTHVLFADADDFLHRDITGWVHEYCDDRTGGFVEMLLERDVRTGSLRQKQNFGGMTAYSHILPTSSLTVLETIRPDSTATDIGDAFGSQDTLATFGNHQHWLDWVHSHGGRMRRIPFPFVIWNRNHGENHSGDRDRHSIARDATRIGRLFGYHTDPHGWRGIAGNALYMALRGICTIRARRQRYIPPQNGVDTCSNG